MRRSMSRVTGGRLRRLSILGAALGLTAVVGLTPAVASPMSTVKPADTTLGNESCTPNGGAGITCTGTYGGDHAWDWSGNGPDLSYPGPGTNPNGTHWQYAAAPTVTVDQTQNLTHQMVHVSWTNFTPSHNISSTVVGYSPNFTEYPVAIWECKGKDPQPDTTLAAPQPQAPFGDCYSIPAQQYANGGVVNAVTTFTTSDGTGSADFQVETAVENTFLGCSDTQPCSLVVVPNWGGREPLAANSPHNCVDHRLDGGPPFGSEFGFNGRTGALCSWADRIVVPLSYAPTPTKFCGLNNNQFYSQGGAALEKAMIQWQPAWCQQNPATYFDFNSTTNEIQARRSFLSGGPAATASTDMALVNRPAAASDTSGSSRQFTYAPVTVSGISIAYYVDNQNTGLPITNLVLNARLMAKLLTESYNLGWTFNCASGQTTESQYCDFAVAGNPRDLFHDPEFYALNPEYTPSDLPSINDTAQILPTVLSGDSDLTYELTRWIESDPDARAFLQGRPDPWGMRVNSWYKGVSYPQTQFLPLDPGWTTPAAPHVTPTETMQLSWNPKSGLDNVVNTLANNSSTALDTSNPACSDPNYPTTGVCHGSWNFPHLPAENLGSRALFAVVDQGSAAAFRFPTAKLVNAAGNAVAPTTTSMTAAVNDMSTNPDKITQFANFATTDPNAYPLTMVWYAMVPTCQLSPATSQAITRFLTNVAGPAQLYGTDLGQLPPFGGYLALNDAQKAQTTTAARSVSAQTCTSPPPDNTVANQPGSTSTPTSNGSPLGSNGSPGSGAGSGATPGTGSGTPNGAPGNTNPSGNKPGANGQTAIPLGLKGLDTGGFLGLALPIALGVGGLLAVVGVVTYLLNATGPGQALLARIRRRLGMPPRIEELGDAE